MVLLAHGGQVAAQGGGLLGSRPTAKAAGDFLLNLKHAEVALSQVIVKGHVEIIEERQHLLALCIEALGQIACFGLFGAPPLTAAWPTVGRNWIGRKGGVEDALIGVGKVLAVNRCEGRQAGMTCGRDGGFGLHEEVPHLRRPGLLEFLVDVGKFT